MNYTISGSKFGLYGYLPAIFKNKKNNVYLPKKYLKFLNYRKDLNKFSKKIVWFDKINEIEKKINYFIIAKRPRDQVAICRKILVYKNLKHLFLEKPIAPNFEETTKLLNFLKKNNINFSVAYIMTFSPFYKKLLKIIKQENVSNINIYWSFFCKNKKNSWKSKKRQGGGILNFYGIHFIHLFDVLGFNKIINSSIKISKRREVEWEINIKKDSTLLNFKLSIDKDNNEFLIDFIRNKKKINLIKYENPFIKKIKNFKKGITEDYRSKYLTNYLKNTKENKYDKYVTTNILFNKIQKKTITKWII